MRCSITNRELLDLLDAPPADFPKYTTQLLNLANQNAQGTRPRVVGTMSELIQEFSGQTLSEWEQWYLDGHPESIEKATDAVYAMIERLRAAMDHIDRAMVERWVRDLVLVKTFIGLRFQEAILKKVAEEGHTTYRQATSEEESAGIDGHIGDVPVSIKPETYRTMSALSETLPGALIFYRKSKTGLEVEWEF